MTILGIAGSLREKSFNRLLLKAAQGLVPEGITLESFDIRGIPVFNQDDEGNPPEIVTRFKTKIRAADAILFVTPEYNYSIPGGLKNAIDWASRPYGDSAWNGKAVAVMSASVGVMGGGRAQYHLRQCFVFLNMYPVNAPEVMVGGAMQAFDAEGNLLSEQTKEMVKKVLTSLADLAERHA